MPTSEKHLSHSANTVQESTVFALIKENNKYSGDELSVPLQMICQPDVFVPMGIQSSIFRKILPTSPFLIEQSVPTCVACLELRLPWQSGFRIRRILRILDR
jgi:hypothetical protein